MNKLNERALTQIRALLHDKSVYRTKETIKNVVLIEINTIDDLSIEDLTTISFTADVKLAMINSSTKDVNEKLYTITGYAEVEDDRVIKLSGTPYNISPK